MRVPGPVKAMATGSGVDFREGQPVNHLQVIVLFTLKRAFCPLEDKLLVFVLASFFLLRYYSYTTSVLMAFTHVSDC